MKKTEEEWQKELTPEQYEVLRRAGTERAFTGRYWDNHQEGVYRCAGCGTPLFSSQTKYDSGSGWPSFWAPMDPEMLESHTDRSHGMTRTEVLCHECGGHLGHLFQDGPQPTGQRFCINSASLDFHEEAAHPGTAVHPGAAAHPGTAVQGGEPGGTGTE